MLKPSNSDIVALWTFYSNAEPKKIVVECINFDHMSCVFVQRIAQLHLIGYV